LEQLSSALEILDRMIAFPTLSAHPNVDFIEYVEEVLRSHGLVPFISWDEDGKRANIHALIGPRVNGGVVLNGHTDVVPADAAMWRTDPFRLTINNDRAYGRGTTDMKGFLACMLASIPQWLSKTLVRPIQVSFSYDEEIGGLGAPILVGNIIETSPRPSIAIVGEPTRMRIVDGHKSAFEMTTKVRGKSAHASDPRKGANAAFFAARLISEIENVAAEFASSPSSVQPFDPPYDTLSVGTLKAGMARNIIPDLCEIDWEIRSASISGCEDAVRRIINFTSRVLQEDVSYSGIDVFTDVVARVPSLEPRDAVDAVALIASVTGSNSRETVPFGTDAGHFAAAGISTAIFGPGSIEQAHQHDEYIELSELSKCLSFMNKLGDRLCG
jgi:acetylornithine deacetylase